MLGAYSETIWVVGFRALLLIWGTAMRVQLRAIYYGLLHTWEKGFVNVIVETDSLNALNAIEEGNNSAHPQWALIQAIKELLRRNWTCQLVHKHRECNRAADWLADFGLSQHYEFSVLATAPPGLSSILLADCNGSPMPRTCLSSAVIM